MSKCEARGCSLISLRINKGKKKQNKEKTAFLTDLRCVSSFRQIRFTVYSLHTEQSATRIKKSEGKRKTERTHHELHGVRVWSEDFRKKNRAGSKAEEEISQKKWHDMNNNRVKKKKKSFCCAEVARFCFSQSPRVLLTALRSRTLSPLMSPSIEQREQMMDNNVAVMSTC